MAERVEGPITGPRSELHRGDAGYPEALAGIAEPPKALYVIGDAAALQEGLAVVGARRATPYGRNAARMFAGRAAQRGVVVISGGAIGCDAFAHEAALDAGARTVAFLGGGCDMPYPSRNVGLFQRIVDGGGAVVSEHPWGFPPQGYTFRARNRLIAGLARATLIVEAGLPSGTFSTADEALAADREVLVVPGSIFSATSRGANALLSQGAFPVVDEEGFETALDRLFPETSARRAFADAPGGDADPIVAALAADPMRLDRIVALFSEAYREGGRPATASRLMAHIVRLEAQGAIERFPDGRFGAVSSPARS